MCGVFGYFNRNGRKALSEELDRMAGPIRNRGPDAYGQYLREDVAFGHLRLSVRDLGPKAAQPMVAPDQRSALTYAGELNNSSQLRHALERQGARFVTTCDTEVVFKSLRQWGVEEATRQFHGMFGFAYYEANEGVLWLARDPLGIKPLYVADCGDVFVFASEIKALLAHSHVPCEPNVVAVTTHLANEYVESPWTLFRGIQAVAPGAVLRVDSESIRQTRYFDIVANLDVHRLVHSRQTAPGVLLERFGRTFQSAIASHLASDVPLATSLSGGVDSSLITAVVGENAANIPAYVANVEGAKPEAEKARKVAAHLGVPLRVVDVSDEEYLYEWPAAVWHLDHPSSYASDPAFLLVAKACERDGVKVILTGEGSDELFGGYPWQEAAYRLWKRRDSWLSRLLQRLSRLGRAAEESRLGTDRLLEWTFSRFPFPSPFDEHRILRQQLSQGGGICLSRWNLLLDKLDVLTPVEDRIILAICLNDMYGHLESLLQRADRLSMAASVECRVPFLDDALVDLAMHAPLRAKYHNRTAKWVVREFARRYLPRQIVDAAKIGFSVNKRLFAYGLSLVRKGVIRDMLCWSSQGAEALLSRVTGSPNILYQLVSMELWARMYFDGQTKEELGEQLVHCRAGAGKPTR